MGRIRRLVAKPLWIAAFAVTLQPPTCSAQSTQAPHNILTRGILSNRDVITLANAGFSEVFIVQLIKISPQNFDITADALADLSQNGLTEHVIGAITNAAMTSQPIPPNSPPTSGQAGLPPHNLPALPQKIVDFPNGRILQPDNNESPNGVVAVNGHRTLRQNPRIFLAEIPNGLDGFLTAEIIKQRLPITITVDEPASDYILSGDSLRTLNSYRHYHTKDDFQGNVRLVDPESKQVVWAGEAGDRSLLNPFKRVDQRKLADRIISQMKKDLFH